jgi:trk system potassium uptake protein TrkA
MYIFVVGGGRIGYSIAEYFSIRGDKVIVVEKNKKICDFLAKSLDVTVYCGDARSIALLEDAEMDKADVVFAVSGSDTVNIRVAEIAKKRFGVPTVVVRLNHSENREKALQTGADHVICLDEFADVFIKTITESEFRIIYDRSGFSIAEIKIPPDSSLVGQSIKVLEELEVKPIAVFRETVYFSPTENIVIEADDILLVTGSQQAINKLKEHIFGAV